VLDHPLQLPVRKALEQRVADFEKAFPGAKVEYDGVVEPNDNTEKFAILVAAGTMPDVSATHTAFLTQYSHFSDLAPYLARDKSLFRTTPKQHVVVVAPRTRHLRRSRGQPPAVLIAR
jgi:ABC-type glycerol-3-phosphate transport system substrate-binding protein